MIVGERIRLRAVERSDLPRYVEWLNDPQVTSGVGRFLPMGIEEEEQWCTNMLERDPIERPFAIDVLVDEDWSHIGGCGLFGFNHQARCAELGIMIGARNFWDQGFGSEVIELLLQYGFQTLNLHRIFLHVHAFNERAIRVYRRLQFIEEGRLRDHHYFNGQYCDTLIMSILREEWQEGRGSGVKNE
jgi:diamine N-acetyltransferase